MKDEISKTDCDSPFGTYALSPWRERLRALGDLPPAGKNGQRLSSAMRRLALAGHERGLAGPHDIDIAAHVKARLYPHSNRCEKRAFAGVQHWDHTERAILADAIASHNGQPFIFLDVGSNVGLYSLFAFAEARRAKRDIRIIAVEPDPENRARLQFNIAASEADIEVEPVAISTQSGTGQLSASSGNRGGIGLVQSATIGGVEVPLESLVGLATARKLPHIDAMKLDIEGHDYAALEAFFADAAAGLFPKLLILETGRGKSVPLIDLALANGYELSQRAGINTIMRLKTAGQDEANDR